ncbi:hypothetical protein GCM10010389_38900 [Streptomyces echinoruber]|uniref:Uncharacterized protein n=1 Tax=Streptomyces echinoruber TaxID=68898 RepID=A0A918RED6_9ACTN|nr:hypothetical protein GCM10010389_38900 [Streptomyces echinoruber]
MTALTPGGASVPVTAPVTTAHAAVPVTTVHSRRIRRRRARQSSHPSPPSLRQPSPLPSSPVSFPSSPASPRRPPDASHWSHISNIGIISLTSFTEIPPRQGEEGGGRLWEWRGRRNARPPPELITGRPVRCPRTLRDQFRIRRRPAPPAAERSSETRSNSATWNRANEDIQASVRVIGSV